MACTRCGKNKCNCERAIQTRGPVGPQGRPGRDGKVRGLGTQGNLTYVESINNEGEIVRLATSSLTYQKANIIASGAGVGTRYLSTDSLGNLSWVAGTGGGGMSGVGDAGYYPVIDTTDMSGNILTLKNGYIQQGVGTINVTSPSFSNYQLNTYNDSGSATLIIDEKSFVWYNTPTVGTAAARFSISNGEVSMQSISMPLGYSGIIGIDTAGNLFTTSAGIALSSTLTGLNIAGSSITSSDTIIGAFGALQNQINGLLGGTYPQGLWNAATNTPSLASGVGTNGYYYIVNVSGSTDLDGITDWKLGDWAIFLNGSWSKVDNTDAVISVNGGIGAVTITIGGTSNRVSVTGGSGLTPIIDIASTYAGQSSITTVGALTSGSLSTGFTAIGDSFISSASTWNSKQAGSASLTSLSGLTYVSASYVKMTAANTFALATSVPAADIAAGTFGSGAYTIGTSLSTPSLIGTSGQIAHTSVAQSSGAITDYLFTPSNHTGQTASTNIPVFKIASSTKTLAAGALTDWYAIHFQSQTIAFASASTVTNAYGAYFESPAAGTLATITNYYSLGASYSVKIGTGLTGAILRGHTDGNTFALYSTNVVPASSNFILQTNSATTFLNNGQSGGTLYCGIAGIAYVTYQASAITNAMSLVLKAGAATAGTYPLKFQSSGTGLTGLLSTAVAGVMEFTTYGLWITTTTPTRHKVWHGLVGASAPATTALAAFTSYYGTGGTVALSTPDSWGTVVGDDGVTRKFPLYN